MTSAFVYYPELHWLVYDSTTYTVSRTSLVDHCGFPATVWPGDQHIPWKECINGYLPAERPVIPGPSYRWLIQTYWHDSASITSPSYRDCPRTQVLSACGPTLLTALLTGSFPLFLLLC